MVVRRERVILDLEDNLTAGMLRAAAATKFLDRSLGDLDRSTVLTHQRVKSFATDDTGGVKRLADQAGIANSEFRDLSARTLILADTLGMLVPTIAPIGAVAIPGIMGLASALGFATIATGGAVLAFQGVFDALDKVNKAALEPTEANLKAANLAMEQLSPTAQELVKHLQELRPAFQALRDASAAGMFPGIDKSLDSFEKLLPMLEQIAFTIGDASGDIAASAGQSFASARWAPFFHFLNTEARPTLIQTAETVGALTHGLAELWMAFQPLNRDVGDVFNNAAKSFDRWAASLSQTDGFQEFVEYARQSGPQVADALSAIADAIVEILEAMAPIGGPALHAVEQLATALGMLADSPVGPALLAGVAAMSTMRMGARLLDSTLRSGPVRSIRDLSTSMQILRQTGLDTTRMSKDQAAAFGLAASTARQSAMALAKPTALVAGLAFASSGAAEKMGLVNTTSLALMGLFAGGPWAAAIGGAVGLILDINDAYESTAKMGEDFANTLDQQTGALTRQSRAWIASQMSAQGMLDIADELGISTSEVTDVILQGADAAEAYRQKLLDAANASGQIGDPEYRDAINELGTRMINLGQAVDSGRGMFDAIGAAVDTATAAYRRHQQEIRNTIEAMEALRAERLRALNAEINWHSAILDANDAIKQNGRTLADNTRAGLDNQQKLLAVGAAWNELSNKAQNVPGAYRRAIRTFVDIATQMGMTEEAARDLARSIMEIPNVKIKADTDTARAQIRSFQQWLAGQNFDKVGHIRMITDRGPGPQVNLTADGGTVPKTGLPYADRHLYLLADGEEVISNRYGQADRHRAHLKAINAGLLADGGTAGRGGSQESAVRELADAAKESAKAMKEEAKARRDAVKQRRQEAASTVSGLFTGDPFATDSIWAAGDPTANLKADTAQARLMGRYLHKLRGRHLNGNALAAIWGAQDPMAAAAQLAGMSNAQLRKYELAFNRRARAARQTGAYAGQAAFGAGGGGEAVAVMVSQQAETNRRLHAIERELSTHPHRTGAAVSDGLKSSVKTGHARRRKTGKGASR